jgi:hypothetical protein
MSKELIVQLRDDLSKTLSDDVQTREFSWEGTDYEIELNDVNHKEMCGVMQKYLDVARPAKRQRKKHSRAAPAKPRKTYSWATEIHSWATKHGLDWSDKTVRDDVRQWAGTARTGIVPKPKMEAYVKAHRNG